MRSRISLYLFLASFLCLSLHSASAQFLPPQGDEIEMKAEPKAPGAAAIYLYREETVDDNLHFHSFYERIKVLTEKGKELATVSVPYEKGQFSITDVKARTIHPDGTIIPLDVKPADLVEHKGAGFQMNKVVFTLPSVEVGSILEYKWQLRYDDTRLNSPIWPIQQKYYVRKAHYSFVPYKFLDRVTDSSGNAASKLLYTTLLPKGAEVKHDATGRYFLDVADVSPLPDEEYMPPIASVTEQVEFYYTSSYSKDDFWRDAGNRWSKEMDHFAAETKTLRDAVAGIIAPSDSEDQKAHKLYDAVMKLDNTDFTRRKSQAELKQMGLKQIKTADDVWKQKGGSSDEIALLYMDMARIAGLKAYAMTVCNRNRTTFNPWFLSLRQLDDVIVIVSIGGKETAVDPGHKSAIFGQLSWIHMAAGGIRQSDKGIQMIQTPGNSYKEATTMRIGVLDIAADGSVKGTVRIAMNGPAATYWRNQAIESDEDEIKKRFNEGVERLVPEGINAELDHFLGLEDYHSQLMAIVKVSGSMGTVTGKRVFLPGVFFESHARHPFVAVDKRQTPVSMEYAESVVDEVTYRLPDSFTVESMPGNTDVPWKGRAALILKTSQEKNQLTIVRNYTRAFVMLDATEYPALRDFYQKMAAADQQQLVLVAGSASNGN